MLKHVALNEL